MPDKDFGALMKDYAGSRAETFFAVLPLALLGGGIGTYRDLKNPAMQMADRNLEFAGFGPTQRASIAKATTPEEKAAAQTGIKLVLADGQVLPQTGTIDFADRAVDPATGSYRLRAVFPNPGMAVLPGQFGRVQIRAQLRKGAVTVPDRAVVEQFGSYFVMVVGKDKKAEQRQIKVGAQVAGEWIIEGGLKPGEQIIVEGLAKVQPGMLVEPLPLGKSKPYADAAMKKVLGD
jgi:multidrug efflux pump subunit AcrA (membrane-fusion protein)